MRLGNVLNNSQPVLPGDFKDRVHVGRHAVNVHGHNRLGVLRDRPLDEFRIDPFAAVRRVSPRPDGHQSLKSSLAQEYSDYVFFDTETLEQFEKRRSETP